MTEEIWKQIKDFPRYEVSNLGNIRSENGILNGGLDSDGYRQVNLYTGNGGGYRNWGRHTRKVYRLEMETFTENTENKPMIDHINRNRTDDRLENLRWATAQENASNRGQKSDMIGINWNKKNRTWMVRVHSGVGNGQVYVGCRNDLEEAKILRDESVKRYSVINEAH